MGLYTQALNPQLLFWHQGPDPGCPRGLGFRDIPYQYVGQNPQKGRISRVQVGSVLTKLGSCPDKVCVAFIP